ncbi:MAG: hypothetical protein PVF73_11165 [Bacteroidales bacterium]
MRICLFLLCLCLSLSASAKKEPPEFSPHEAGFCLGSITGMGPAYRYWPGKFGFQLALLPYKVDSEWNDLLDVQGFAEGIFSYQRPYEGQKKFISIGLTGLYTFKQYKNYKLLSYLGNHLVINNHDELYNIGTGVGISFDKRVSFSLMVGYGAYDVLDDLQLLPAGDISLFIRFNKKKRP